MNKMFIDLEGVLIDNWHDANCILEYTGEQIKSLFDQYCKKDQTIDLFSYAVDNEKDKECVWWILLEVQKLLGIKFHNVITVENVIDEINWTDFMFVLKQRGKRYGFIEYIRNISHLDETVDNYILLDDSVEDEVIDMGSHKIIFRQIV